MGDGLPWCALRVRSNFERTVSLHLREKGYEEFSPSYPVERQWSDRRKTIEQSLFPGYVFCRFDLNNRLPILVTPGVVGVLGFGKTATPIPEHEIERVRSLVNSGVLVSPWPFLQLGDEVLIEHGPLAGLEGILQKTKGKLRIVVSINLLQRSVSAEIDRAWVRPIKRSVVSKPNPAYQINATPSRVC